MPVLPTYVSQQGIQPAQAPTIPNLGAPVAQALSQGGQVLQQTGSQLTDLDARYNDIQKKKQEFNNSTNLKVFTDQLQTDYNDFKTTQAPADGDGLASAWQAGMDEKINDYLKTVPDNLKEQTANQLRSIASDFSRVAATDEVNTGKHHYLGQMNDDLAGIQQQIEQNPNQAGALIAGWKAKAAQMPYINSTELEDLGRVGDKTAAESWLRAHDPAQIQAATGIPLGPQGASASGSGSTTSQETVTALTPYVVGGASKDPQQSIGHMNPALSGGLQKMIADMPPELQSKIAITSGYRTPEHQQELWDAALKKYGSAEEARKWVAPPGNSQHNMGNAADFSLKGGGDMKEFANSDVGQWVHANADKYGLHFRLENEGWHVEATNPTPTTSTSNGTGGTADYFSVIRQHESGGNDSADNGTAVGRYQFTSGTWSDVSKAHPELGLTPDGRTDPSQQEKAIRAFTQDNQNALQSAGIDPNNANTYMAHFLGAQGAIKFIKAMQENPNQSAADLFPDAAANNKGVFYSHTSGGARSLKEVFDAQTKMFGSAAGSAVGGGIPTLTPPAGINLNLLSPDEIRTIYGQAVHQQTQFQALAQAQLEPKLADVSSAIQQSGSYSGGPMPTQQDFNAAYGTIEGAQRFAAFQRSVDVAKNIFGYNTLNNQQIAADVEQARQGITSGVGAAQQQAVYETKAKAYAKIQKDREEDPAAYVLSTNPQVGNAYQQAVANKSFGTAYNLMDTVQGQIGIPSQDRKYLAKSTIDDAIKDTKNDALTFDQKFAKVKQLMGSAQTPDQQKAVFNQLVTGGLDIITGQAFEAYSRGDQGAGDRLLQAATTKPEKLPVDGTIKPKDIDATVQNFFAPGQMGDVVYGLHGGDGNNQQRAMEGQDLFKRAIQMRIAQGATDLNKAAADAAKDMFGDIHVMDQVTTNGIHFQGTVDNSIADRAVTNRASGVAGINNTSGSSLSVMNGLASFKPQIIEGINRVADQQNRLLHPDANQAALKTLREGTVDKILNDGTLTNYGRDGYAFRDNNTGKWIPGADGQPLVFKMSDFLGAASPSAIAPAQSPAPVTLPNPFQRNGGISSNQVQQVQPAPPSEPTRPPLDVDAMSAATQNQTQPVPKPIPVPPPAPTSDVPSSGVKAGIAAKQQFESGQIIGTGGGAKPGLGGR